VPQLTPVPAQPPRCDVADAEARCCRHRITASQQLQQQQQQQRRLANKSCRVALRGPWR